MESNTQTSIGSWDYYHPPGNFVASTPQIKQQTSFLCHNGTKGSDFSRPTSYGFRKRTVWNDNGFYQRQEAGYQAQQWFGPHPGGLGDPFGWTSYSEFSELFEVALGRLMDDVRGGNQVVVDLAESASTMRMVRANNNLVGRVNEIVGIIGGEIKRADRKGFFGKYYDPRDRRDRTQKILDFANSRWLEYRYGWLPLVGSVYDALDILHKENLERVRTIVATAKRRTNGTRSYAGHLTFIGTVPGIHTHEATERCRVVIEMYAPGAGVWDWTSLSPSVIAWELLPMSFVADWFVSVGDSLSYLENWLLWKSQFKSGYVTYSGKGHENWKISGVLNNGSSSITIRRSGGGDSSFKNRIVLSELPLPFAPRVRVNLNASRILDSVTLAASTWRRQIRGFGRQF